MALIGYARVSSANGQNLDSQLDALKAAGCTKIFQDRMSGARDDRPELNKCLKEYLREGDTLVVYKLDRLGRSLHHLIETINKLNKEGINFRSISDNIDTTTASGMLVFHIMGAMAEFERSLNNDRTRSGLESARARGRIGGRPKALDPEKAARIDQLRSQKVTVKTIAKEVGVGEATVYRYLADKKEAYATA